MPSQTSPATRAALAAIVASHAAIVASHAAALAVIVLRYRRALDEQERARQQARADLTWTDRS